jgi:hypothetical protein
MAIYCFSMLELRSYPRQPVAWITHTCMEVISLCLPVLAGTRVRVIFMGGRRNKRKYVMMMKCCLSKPNLKIYRASILLICYVSPQRSNEEGRL